MKHVGGIAVELGEIAEASGPQAMQFRPPTASRGDHCRAGERLLAAQAKLPTKTATNDARIAQNKIDAAHAKLGLTEDWGEVIGWWRF